MRSRLLTTATISLLVLAASAAVFGAASSKPKPKNRESKTVSAAGRAAAAYREGMEAVERRDFESALKSFRKAYARKRSDADILNMLAYSLRKTGKIDDALNYYHKALRKRPQFPEAREYLGEAYLQGAMRELKTRKSYGDKGTHAYQELTDAIKTAAAAIDSEKGSDGKKSGARW